MKALEEGSYQPRHNPYKSDVFSLGMSMLHAGTLENCDSCYKYEQHRFISDEMYRKLAMLDRYYSQPLNTVIKNMLDLNEEYRPDFIQLQQ
jgi:hypothetical protein